MRAHQSLRSNEGDSYALSSALDRGVTLPSPFRARASFERDWCRTVSGERDGRGGACVRLHLHDHLDSAQVEQAHGAVAVAGHAVRRRRARVRGLGLRVDSGHCLALVRHCLGGRGRWHGAERHAVARLA